MIAGPNRDRRAERREATRTEILDAAWELARAQGLAGLSLRDIATKIGMRPPSLYWYFDSKHAIYDAMFADGNRTLLDRLAAQEWPDEPRALLRAVARIFVEFSAEDAARAQLLFQRTIPDFEPSPESYALAIEVVEQGRKHVRRRRGHRPRALRPVDRVGIGACVATIRRTIPAAIAGCA